MGMPGRQTLPAVHTRMESKMKWGKGGDVLIALIISLGLVPIAVDAIGVSPSKVNLPHMSRGAEAFRELSISGIQPGQEVKIDITGAAAGWITPEKQSFIFPESDSAIVRITIRIPSDAANGIYSAQLRFSSQRPAEKGAATVSVLGAVKADVTIEVTGEQRNEYVIKSIKVPTVEEGQEIVVLLDIENTGNVIAAPDMLQMTVLDKHQKSMIWARTETEIDGVPPHSRGIARVKLGYELEPGQYWLSAEAIENGINVFEEKLGFEVAKKGTLSMDGELISLVASAASVGGKAKITGSFKNKGTMPVRAKLQAECKQNNWLLDTLSSDEMLVYPGETKDLAAYYSTRAPGEYEITGVVAYEGRETRKLTTTLKVLSVTPTGMAFANTFEHSGSLAIIAGVILAVVVIIIAIKIRRK